MNGRIPLCLAGALNFCACLTQDSGTRSPQPPPELRNLAVHLPAAPYDSANPPASMGGFVYFEDVRDWPEEWGRCKELFLEFASRDNGCGDLHPSPYGIPNFEYYISPDLGELSAVRSPIRGVVRRIHQSSGSEDSVVRLIPHAGDQWEIELDHVLGIQVREGDHVEAGDVLALQGGYWSDHFHGNTDYPIRRTELQVTHVTSVDGEEQRVSYCPLDARFWPDTAAHRETVERLTYLLEGWNRFTGVEVYDVSDMPRSVCLDSVSYP